MIGKARELFAWIMAQVRLNTAIAVGGAVLKRRKWYAPMIILPGNLISRMRPASVCVLPDKDWFAWEKRIHAALNRIDVTARNAWLRIPAAPGEALQDILKSDRALHEKQRAMAAAGRALRAMHALALSDGVLLSHGDATIRNVVYDPERDRARWIDFDLRHNLRVAARMRHADDLRALLYSACPHAADEDYAALFRAAIEAYGDREVLSELGRRIAHRSLDRDLYHLAQTLAPRPRRDACRDAIAALLGRMDA